MGSKLSATSRTNLGGTDLPAEHRCGCSGIADIHGRMWRSRRAGWSSISERIRSLSRVFVLILAIFVLSTGCATHAQRPVDAQLTRNWSMLKRGMSEDEARSLIGPYDTGGRRETSLKYDSVSGRTFTETVVKTTIWGFYFDDQMRLKRWELYYWPCTTGRFPRPLVSQ
jgi:hypothetical protein